MANAQRKMEGYGRQMQKVGGALTLGVTGPILGIGALAVNAAADFETLNTSLETVFKGNKQAAKEAFDQITDFTSKTPFQLEEVAGGFLKLKNLGLDPSIDSLRSYGNTASGLGKSLDQMIEAVADASVGEFERLKEFGIKAKSEGDNVAFTFQGVTTTVKKNSEEIQEYLLNMGNTTFSGGIERQANTFNGAMSTLKDNVKLLFADFGAIIIEIIKPLTGFLQDIVAKFRELSPETKKFIVILGGVAAAVGPLLALAGTILPAIGTGLTLLTGPIGLIVAGLTAVGVIIYKNWEPIKGVLVDIANYFIDLYNESTIFRIAVEAITTAFKNIYDTGKFIFSVLGGLISEIASNIKNSFTSLGKIIKAVLTGNLKEIPTILANNFNESTKGVRGFVEEAKKNFGDLKENISTNISEGVENAIRGKKYTLLGENVDTQELEDNVANAVTNGLQKGASGAGGPFTPQTEKVGLTFETQGVTNPLGSVAEQLTQSTEGIQASLAATTNELTVFQENAQLVGASVGEAFEGMTGRFIDSLGLADDGFQGFAKNLAKTITKLISMLLANAIANAITGSTASGSATGAAAVFTTPVFIATAVSGVLAAFAAIPKFATGGIVGGSSFYGDKTLARVNSGELILNIAQQKNLAGVLSSGNNITLQPSLRVEGDGIRVLLNRVENNRNRRT
jgi:hypothetical protein